VCGYGLDSDATITSLSKYTSFLLFSSEYLPQHHNGEVKSTQSSDVGS
jgi:hypothetical protein